MSSNEKGLFELREPRDLFEKLKWEFNQFKNSPNNQYIAFNFFVTAEHIPDWIFEKTGKRRVEKSNHLYLRISSQIANGGKHFQVKDPKHQSVKKTEKDRYVEEGWVEPDYFEEPLIIYLRDTEAKKVGKKSITAIELAKKVYEFWENYFK